MLKTVKNRQFDALARISWQDFERLLADYFRDLGFQVEHHGTGSSGARSDGGIDLKLRKGAEYLLVQCKHWNAMQVPHNDVHQLMGIMDNEDATGAILVTSGEFTPAAVQAAARKGRVQLVDGEALRTMLGSRLPPESPPMLVEVGARSRRTRYGNGATTATTEKWLLAMAGMVFVLLLFYIAYRMLQGAMDSLTPAARPQRAEVRSELVRTQASNQEAVRRAFDAGHREFLRSAKIADSRFPVNREAARSAAKTVAGVRSAVWLDRENLLLVVERNEFRTYETIDKVCLKLQPMGDTLGVVVNLQSGAARTADELAILSRNCQLAPGDRAYMQANRQVDVVSAEFRAQHKANNPDTAAKTRPSNAESMKILEATTPALKD